jgi:hypothetical protein
MSERPFDFLHVCSDLKKKFWMTETSKRVRNVAARKLSHIRSPFTSVKLLPLTLTVVWEAFDMGGGGGGGGD